MAQYSGFHAVVVPGTLRDSIFVLEGLLEQQTGLSPREIMTDTAGASDMIFGLFWLLGYQFSPRLADAGESRFWRIDKNADYGVLNELAKNCLKPVKIILLSADSGKAVPFFNFYPSSYICQQRPPLSANIYKAWVC